jgi:hypothetical protein
VATGAKACPEKTNLSGSRYDLQARGIAKPQGTAFYEEDFKNRGDARLQSDRIDPYVHENQGSVHLAGENSNKMLCAQYFGRKLWRKTGVFGQALGVDRSTLK